MTTYINESFGSHDDKSHEYVEVWFDETYVKAFEFHSVITKGVTGLGYMVYGMSVDARHVFSACRAFSSSPNMAQLVDQSYGGRTFVVHVWLADGSEEFRLSSKYGRPIARMRKTGYIQSQQKA